MLDRVTLRSTLVLVTLAAVCTGTTVFATPPAVLGELFSVDG